MWGGGWAQKELIWLHRTLAGSERVYYKTASLAVPLPGFPSCYMVCLMPVFCHRCNNSNPTRSSAEPRQGQYHTLKPLKSEFNRFLFLRKYLVSGICYSNRERTDIRK